MAKKIDAFKIRSPLNMLQSGHSFTPLTLDTDTLVAHQAQRKSNKATFCKTHTNLQNMQLSVSQLYKRC